MYGQVFKNRSAFNRFALAKPAPSVLVNTIFFDRPEGFPVFIRFSSVLSGKRERKALKPRDRTQFGNFLPTNFKKPVSFFQTEVYSTGK